MHRLLWKKLARNEYSEREAFDVLIDSTEETRFEEAIDEMPELVLRRFLVFFEGIGELQTEKESEFEGLTLNQLELHSADGDFELATNWKITRIRKLYGLANIRARS